MVLNRPCRFGILAGLLSALPSWGQNSLSVSCPVQAGPGSSVACSLVLVLGGGVKVDGLTFGAAVTPTGAAPALTQGQLSFSDLVGGGYITTGSTNDQISVVWFSLHPVLSGTVLLGSIGFVVPVSAATAQSYLVTIAGGGASLGNRIVDVSIGSPAPIAVFSACDVNQTGKTDVLAVQKIVNEALGVAAARNDVNYDGVVSVVDVQIVMSAVLGLGCSAG